MAKTNKQLNDDLDQMREEHSKLRLEHEAFMNKQATYWKQYAFTAGVTVVVLLLLDLAKVMM